MTNNETYGNFNDLKIQEMCTLELRKHGLGDLNKRETRVASLRERELSSMFIMNLAAFPF